MTKHPTHATGTDVRRCPDDGRCHHGCNVGCFRVAAAGPLSGVFPGDRWPDQVRAEHADYFDFNAASPSMPAAFCSCTAHWTDPDQHSPGERCGDCGAVSESWCVCPDGYNPAARVEADRG
ncbi:hypothetical protein [Saccharothrix xinjiangensis]|uniref:4Fe-4S ferredoxin-type domain-containing protein n=1 Tax=Saccharothrix xinjiangensis TaxID=204798 RepID=A0ABV9XUN0_9PSEU